MGKELSAVLIVGLLVAFGCEPDSVTDTDAGSDAGSDAGHDAGHDAGTFTESPACTPGSEGIRVRSVLHNGLVWE
jgi:hypothetical protein